MGPGGPMNNGPMGNSGGNGSPMGDMNSPLGPNGPVPPGPMGSPMGGMSGPGPNQMMVHCSKSSPMGLSGGPSGPDPTQPLPPSGLSGNGFNKNSPIMGGPNTSDPNYFQQQLYATNTRSQGGGMGGPGNHSPGYPHRTN